MFPTRRRIRFLLLFAVVGVVLAPSALAAPPANDNRASAVVIPAFPYDAHGTLVEATVERLDPQASQCGSVAATVWYRIDVAPDGIIRVAVKGAAGIAPVVRVYRILRSSIDEEECGVAPAGGTAAVSFETVRGAGYLILVGRRPTAVDGEFDLRVELTLPPDPPANDRVAGAGRIRTLPATVRGTTVGARTDDSDPEACGFESGSVWYRLSARRDGLIVVRLQMPRNLDGVAVVLERRGSRLRAVGCGRTGSNGLARVAFPGRRGTTYFIAVGHTEDSDPGSFTLKAVSAAAPETLAGRALPRLGARGTLNGLTNVNDLWRVQMARGTSYRIAFASMTCARVQLRAPTRRALFELSCRGYRVFTPGPDGGGRYVFEVRAAPSESSQPYRLQVQRVESDDIGVGLPLENHTTRRGRLSPQGVDVVDVYHFDVEGQSDVRLSLADSGGAFALVLATERGGRIASGGTIARRLAPGRYVAAVAAPPGTFGGIYRLTLLVRNITTTTMSLGPAVVPCGTAVVLRPVVTPATGGTVVIQIDRFDTFGGWQFHRLIRIPVGSSMSWIPPTAGTWRARGSFLGTSTDSPSRSSYAHMTCR